MQMFLDLLALAQYFINGHVQDLLQGQCQCSQPCQCQHQPQYSFIYSGKSRTYSKASASAKVLSLVLICTSIRIGLEKGLHSKGWLLDLPTNIRLGWKTNSGNYSSLQQSGINYDRKKFYSAGPCTIKLITAVIDGFL